jgi:regulator of vacuolar morphogenesis
VTAAPSPFNCRYSVHDKQISASTKASTNPRCCVTIMAPQVEISIPNTTVSNTDKPYTIYNITLRLPLRSFTVQKRYSDFTSLQESLKSQAGTAPPLSLPSKSWFSRTVSNPDLTEERRRGLEHYLRTINESEDSRWRNTSAWRSFLNLPSSLSSQTGTKTGALHSLLSGPGGGGAPIIDATVWLDCHRDVKAQLHDARLHLTSRDQASSPQKQHEASAAAKSCLVKVGGMINALEEGLKNIQQNSGGWSSQRLGDGEVRRRKDLIATAKKEKEGLENLLNAMAKKSSLDNAVAAMQDTQNLVGTKPKPGGRVLGKETAETRELDNKGVLQLQKQKMADQDLDVEELRRIVQRQRELGAAINNELEVQNEMLRMVDEDADRVHAKMDIAKKRIGKIS